MGSAFLFAWSSTQEDGNFGVFGRDGKRTAAWTKFHDAATSRGESEHAKESGDGQGSAAAPASNASRLHGAVDANGGGVAGLTVSAWGHANGDYHEATTDALGIYAFEGLDPSSQYNLVVNATFDGAGYTPIDEAHASATRDNVKLTAGGDGWHGENFDLGF